MSRTKTFQIAGYKNTGKTTLVCRLIDRFAANGMRTATIKSDAHGFEDEPQGCDTRLHREAGAVWSAIASPERTAVVMQYTSTLEKLVGQAPDVDVVLVEGFKREKFPKLALIKDADHLNMALSLDGLTGVVLWPQLYDRAAALDINPWLPVYHIDEVEAIASHILRRLS